MYITPRKKTNPTREVRVGRTRGMRKEDFRLSPSQKGLSYQHLVWGRTCIFLRKTKCGLLETKQKASFSIPSLFLILITEAM